jgi:hypothetical protein
LTSLVLAACGSSHPSTSPGQRSTAGGTASDGSAMSAAKPAAAAATSAASAPTSSAGADALPALDTQRLIIRNGELDLTVMNLGDSLAAARQVAADAGGLVFSSSTAGASSAPSASLTLQVPSDRFDSVLTALRSLAGVTEVGRENVTSQDVTDEYVDLQARERNLQATEQQYLTLLSKATTINDTLAVEQQLSRVQGDLEQVQGRIKFFEQRTSYSRIMLTMHSAVAEVKPTAETGIGNAASFAWHRSLHFVEAVAEAAVTVVVFFWWFWPLLAAGLYLARRRLRPATLPAEPRA